jgi:hypothetical protein
MACGHQIIWELQLDWVQTKSTGTVPAGFCGIRRHGTPKADSGPIFAHTTSYLFPLELTFPAAPPGGKPRSSERKEVQVTDSRGLGCHRTFFAEATSRRRGSVNFSGGCGGGDNQFTRRILMHPSKVQAVSLPRSLPKGFVIALLPTRSDQYTRRRPGRTTPKASNSGITRSCARTLRNNIQ